MATARVPTMYRYAMSSLVFLDGAGHLNEPVHARPTVQSNISPTEYAYAVMHPESEKHYIRELWERARANGQYAVTYMTQPWPEGATAETVFAENRQRFLHGARFFQNSFAVIEPEMVAMIEVMRNIVFVIPEGGVAQYDRAGGRERNSSFIAAERPWAMHTVEIGETDYLALRRQLWRYVNALMDIEVRPFFRCLAGREGGVMAYECYRRGENGKGLLVQPRTMSVYSMDEIRQFEAAAMYVQRVVMPAATWLAQETEGFREQGWGLHAHLEDTLTRLKEDVLPGLEAQFAQHCPVLPDGRRTGVVFTLSQGQAESVMRRD